MIDRPTSALVSELRNQNICASLRLAREAADRLVELEAEIAKVKAILAEDYHPAKSDGWWDGYTELSDRLEAVLS